MPCLRIAEGRRDLGSDGPLGRRPLRECHGLGWDVVPSPRGTGGSDIETSARGCVSFGVWGSQPQRAGLDAATDGKRVVAGNAGHPCLRDRLEVALRWWPLPAPAAAWQ